MPAKKIEIPEHIDLEEFLSIQAHDLRTPFNHITGFSKMLLNTVGSAPLTDFQKEDLGTVYRSGMRALTLMNGLIDMARINRQEKHLSAKETDIEQLVAQSLVQWKKFNPNMNVQVDYQIQTKSKTLQVDEQLNRQVIAGSIAFAAGYCDPGAKINIRVTEEDNWIVFSLASSGKKPRQPSNLDREMFGYIMQKLIEAEEGEIRQADETEDGAIVQFALPRN